MESNGLRRLWDDEMPEIKMNIYFHSYIIFNKNKFDDSNFWNAS